MTAAQKARLAANILNPPHFRLSANKGGDKGCWDLVEYGGERYTQQARRPEGIPVSLLEKRLGTPLRLQEIKDEHLEIWFWGDSLAIVRMEDGHDYAVYLKETGDNDRVVREFVYAMKRDSVVSK